MVPASENLPNFTGHIIDDGRFQLLDVLGSGAFGVVYRAVDNASLEGDSELIYYAVKCLRRSSKLPEAQTREFSLQLSVCDHPNIVTIHDVICDDLYIYVIMDYCPGGDLFGAITEYGLFQNNAELIRTTFVQLIDAVHACHEKGVFHRDLKPENVLCSEDGSQVFLSDFGLATRKKVCKDFGCGSVFYMSPECIGAEIRTGGYSTRHSDIWSLGVILANMVTGRNPWRYAQTKDISFSAYIHDPDFLRSVLPISKGANKIFNRIFTLNPLRRITLPELRVEISKLDTFFMSGTELLRAPSQVRAAAETYGGRDPSVDLAVPGATPESADPPPETDDETSDSDERYVYPSPKTEHVCQAECSCRYDQSRVRSVDITDFSADSLSNCSSSEDESEGPITPETLTADPVTAVPDLPDDENIGEPFCVHTTEQVNKKSRVQVALFRKVVHNILAK